MAGPLGALGPASDDISLGPTRAVASDEDDALSWYLVDMSYIPTTWSRCMTCRPRTMVRTTHVAPWPPGGKAMGGPLGLFAAEAASEAQRHIMYKYIIGSLRIPYDNKDHYGSFPQFIKIINHVLKLH